MVDDEATWDSWDDWYPDMLQRVKQTPPPKRLSALLCLAVRDAQRARKRRGVRLDMRRWFVALYTSADGTRIIDECAVCMAGAVMLCTLGVRKDMSWTPDDFPRAWGDALVNIDTMRYGKLPAKAWRASASGRLRKVQIPAHVHTAFAKAIQWQDNSGRAPWRDYLKAATILEQAGF